MFRVGDEIRKFRMGAKNLYATSLPVGTQATIEEVVVAPDGGIGLKLVGLPDNGWGHMAECWKKVQKRNSTLTIESFSVIKDGGYEEKDHFPLKERTKEKTQ